MGTLYSWLKTGGKAVLHNVAEERAMTCAQCPKHRRGKLRDFFTRKAAKLIQEQIERKQEMDLWTSVDALLGTCSACGCVCQLLVHVPLDLKLKHLKDKTRKKLDQDCWVLSEEKALKTKSA